LGLAEQLLLGVVDTAMMGQNALTAAESLGLGGVYIGGIRNNIRSEERRVLFRSKSGRRRTFQQPDGTGQMKRFAFALWLSAISLNAYADSANCHQ
ncbi:hypothetical protein MJN51_30445, partial [Salmonella enterica subsp. enterica serovar Kentucky]|nr:hypothetical protein [Salmonella enterica subsp. enterica serovar Kentucky]